jgi:hypothetical protein
MSGRAGIALVVLATALFTGSSATADPVSTSPPELSVAQVGGDPGSGPTTVLTVAPGSWASKSTVYGNTYQWQRCNYQNAVIDQAPMAYYRLDDQSGTTAADSSGLGFDGTSRGRCTSGSRAACRRTPTPAPRSSAAHWAR